MIKNTVLGSVDVTFLEDNAVSQNGRMYLPEAVESALQAGQADLARNVPITVFATHADGLADDASKMAGHVTRVWREGSRALARLELFATESGRNIAAVLKGGGLRTCSLRSNDFATGAPRDVNGKTVETISRMRLSGIDFTMQPGLSMAGVGALALESQGAGRRLWEAVDVAVHDIDLPMLSEAGLPKSAYAYTPDEIPSHWKLRIDDAGHVGGAIAALGKGYRGKRVQLPAAARAGVKRKIRAAWKKFHPDKSAEDMPAVLKETAALEAVFANISDWQPCQTCMDGDPAACECPGCMNDGECWCSAAMDADDDDDMEESDMTKEEIEKLIAESVASAVAATRATTEATHAHVHEHEGIDGGTYSHEHTHRHEGTADHEDAGAHLHAHGVTYEALIHVPAKQLAEALSIVLKQQGAGIRESGKTLSAATVSKLQALREAAHSGVCETLDGMVGGGGAMGEAMQVSHARDALAESLAARKTLTEENATLTKQLAESQEALKAATAKADTLTDVLGKDWRPQRKVPVESLLGSSSADGGDRELSDKELRKLYADGLAAKVGVGR